MSWDDLLSHYDGRQALQYDDPTPQDWAAWTGFGDMVAQALNPLEAGDLSLYQCPSFAYKNNWTYGGIVGAPRNYRLSYWRTMDYSQTWGQTIF